jgi:hypothetical protein
MLQFISQFNNVKQRKEMKQKQTKQKEVKGSSATIHFKTQTNN